MPTTPAPQPPAPPTPGGLPQAQGSGGTPVDDARLALHATQAQLDAFFQALPDPAGISRLADGLYLEVNPAFCQYFGLERGQIIGRTSAELHIWATQEERKKLVDALRQHGKADKLPMRVRRGTESIPGTMSAQPVRIGGEDCLVFVFHDTSIEEQALRQLQAKNDALDQAGRMARLGYWEDRIGRGLVFWSGVCFDIHGLPHSDTPPSDYIHTCVAPPWRDAVHHAIREAAHHHRPWGMELELLRPDGSTFWGRAYGEPILQDGHLVGFRGVMQDIDAHKRAEQRLRQSEDRFTRIFHLLPPMCLVRRGDGVLLEVNPAFEALFGYPRQDILGRNVAEVGFTNQAMLSALVQQMQPTGQIDGQELVVTVRDGSQRTVLMSMRFAELDGQVCRLVALQDITERKQQEEAVREREAVFSLALSTAALGLWDWNLHSGLITGNERWRSMLGMPEGTMQGPAFQWSAPMNPEEVLELTTEVERHAREPDTPFDVTLRNRNAHEKHRWIRNIGKIIHKDADGQPLRMLGIAMDVTAQREQENLLRRLAHYDTLTGLPNRAMFARKMDDTMEQARQMGSLLGVAYLDLDGFKPVNDRLGHDAGDRLLVVAAQRMARALRTQDCVARLGGDEFAILLPALQSVQEGRQLLTQAMQSLALPYQIGANRVNVTASIGFTLYPQDDSDADTLLRHADQAMYAAKQAGRNRLHEFDLTQERQSRQSREQVQRLRQALAHGEFELFLQPKVDMRQGTVVGAEALARWRHPEKGVLAPGAFLPQLEGTELEVPFGVWVLKAGLKLLRSLQAQGIRIPLSINISAPHLQQPDFAQWMAAELRQHSDITPELLEVEITETAALYHIEPVAQTLGELRALGVGVALDDFGTGYSSLSYLRRLPLTTLKVDQSFVRGMMGDAGDLAIEQGVIGLARSFGYRAVAEGVETLDQGQLLVQLGCPLAQGYHIAKPMPPEEFVLWSQTWQCPPEWQR